MFATPEDQLRFVILVSVLGNLGMAYAFIQFWFLPWFYIGKNKNQGEVSVVPMSVRRSIARYLNLAAHYQLDLDPAVAGVSQSRTFQAFATETGLEISVQGFDQAVVHQFLERRFSDLNTVAVLSELPVGMARQGSYQSQWRIIQAPRYGVPEENFEVIEKFNETVQLFINPFLEEIRRVYPTTKIDYSINVEEGVVHVVFSPMDKGGHYFGIKDTPREYSGFINHVLNNRRGIPYASNFSLASYDKDQASNSSSIVLKYKALEGSRGHDHLSEGDENEH